MSFGATPFRPLTSTGGKAGFRGAQSLPAVTPLQGLRLAYEGGSRGQIGNVISRPFGAAANTNNATASIVEAGDTLSSASTLAIAAALAVTEGGDTLVSATTLALAATLAVTEAGDTLASAATLALAATLAVTEANDTLASAAALALAATAGITEAGDTLTSASALAIAASASLSEAGDTLASAGTLAIAATATITEAGDTVASASALSLAATAAITEAGDTLSSAETLSSTATASIIEADDGLSATATMGLAATTTTITAAGAGGVLGVGEKRYSPPDDKPAAVRKVKRKAIPTRAVANTAGPPLAEAIMPLPALYLGALLRTPEPPTMEKPATAAWGIAEDEAEIEMLLLLAA